MEERGAKLRVRLSWSLGEISNMIPVMTMPKPKKSPRGRKPETEPRRVVLQMKGSDAWKEWLDELARHLRMPTSAAVDNALVQYAKTHGFDKPAPDR
jgi:hypothetical protein